MSDQSFSNAWVAYDEEYAYPIHAETRGKARAQWANEFGNGARYGFEDTLRAVRIRRAPQFDGRPFDHWDLLNLGYYHYSECDDCGRRISVRYVGEHDYAEAVRTEDGQTLCSCCAGTCCEEDDDD